MFYKISDSPMNLSLLKTFSQEGMTEMVASFNALKLIEDKALYYLANAGLTKLVPNFTNAIGLNFCDSWFVCGEDAPEQHGYALANSISDLINNFSEGHLYSFEYGPGFVVYNAPCVSALLKRLDKERSNLLAVFASDLLATDSPTKL